MTAFTEKLDRAASAATCAVLEVGGASLIGSGVVGLAAGGTGIVPLAAGAAAVMASSFLNCSGWDPNQGEPSPPPGPSLCWEGASTYQLLGLQNGADYGSATPVIKRITAQDVQPAGSGGTNAGLVTVIYSWAKEGGATGTTSLFSGSDDAGNVYTLNQIWTGDPTCEVPSPEQPPIDIPPFEYTDPEDGCELTVNFQGFGSGAGGNANPVFKIEPKASTRAESDVIGGCNFEPVIYMGDPNGGPPYVGPWEPDWDTPGGDPYKWKDKLKDIANICSNEDVISLLNQLLVDPCDGVTYELQSVCEVDSACKPEEKFVTIDIPAKLKKTGASQFAKTVRPRVHFALLGSFRKTIPLTVVTICGSAFVIGQCLASDLTPSSTTGKTSSSTLAQLPPSTAELLGELLLSGPLRQKKASGSSVTLLQKRLSMSIVLDDGKLAAVLLPVSACPGE